MTTEHEQRVHERLATIDPAYITEAYRQQLLEAAEVQEFVQRVQAVVSAAESALTAAIAGRDLAAANAYASGFLAAQAVAQRLPQPHVSPTEIAECLGRAERDLAQAFAFPDVPEVDYEAELAKWRLLPPHIQQTQEPPTKYALDAEASQQREVTVAWVQEAVRDFQRWQEDAYKPGHDPLDFLASATSHVQRAPALRAEVESTINLIEKATAERQALQERK